MAIPTLGTDEGEILDEETQQHEIERVASISSGDTDETEITVSETFRKTFDYNASKNFWIHVITPPGQEIDVEATVYVDDFINVTDVSGQATIHFDVGNQVIYGFTSPAISRYKVVVVIEPRSPATSVKINEVRIVNGNLSDEGFSPSEDYPSVRQRKRSILAALPKMPYQNPATTTLSNLVQALIDAGYMDPS